MGNGNGRVGVLGIAMGMECWRYSGLLGVCAVRRLAVSHVRAADNEPHPVATRIRHSIESASSALPAWASRYPDSASVFEFPKLAQVAASR